VIVCLHWGPEWTHLPHPDQLRLARHAIDSGADLVVGCHSHTIQAYEQYKGKWIFYGIGNFLFGTGEATEYLPDGSVRLHKLKSRSEGNTESLALEFEITATNGKSELRLKSQRFLRQQSNYTHQLIEDADLSFDLQRANNDLRRFTERETNFLMDRSEPKYISSIENGTVIFRYDDRSILYPPEPLYSRKGRKIAINIPWFSR